MSKQPRPSLQGPKAYAGKVIAITSGKGGVGKSTIAVNLAICLVEAGLQLRLMDADLPLGNLDILLNIRCRYSVADLVSGRRQLSEVIHRDHNGLEVLSATTGSVALAYEWTFDLLQRQIRQIRDGTELVLIDTASGISRSVLGWCLAADAVWIVTTPEATSMADAYAMIKALVCHCYQGQMYLLVNMAQSYKQARQVYIRISSVARRFLGLPIGHVVTIPLDEDVQRSILLRRPVVISSPDSGASTAFRALASRLRHSLAVGPSSRKDADGFDMLKSYQIQPISNLGYPTNRVS